MIVIQTDRLYLCQLTTQDAPFILELLNTPSWIEYIGDRGVKTLDDARTYILKGPMTSYDTFGFGLYIVKLQASNLPVGLCGLLKRETFDDVDIGFAFLPQHTRNGYAYEAAAGVMAHARATLHMARIVAITIATNQRSIALLERLGLHYETTIRLADDPDELLLFGINWADI